MSDTALKLAIVAAAVLVCTPVAVACVALENARRRLAAFDRAYSQTGPETDRGSASDKNAEVSP